MKVLPDLGEAQHRLRDPPRQHVEGDELAHAEAAPDHQQRPEIERRGRHQLADELNRLTCQIAERRDPKAGADIAGELLFPAALHLGLDRHRLQCLDAGDRLDEEGLVLGAASELLVEPMTEDRRQPGGESDVERKGADHHAGQQRRVAEHDGQEQRRERQIDHEGERGAGQEAADVLQLSHPRHRIARATGLEIGERQRHQMPEQARPQLDVDAVGGMREDIGAQAAENGLEDRDGDEADHQDVERGQSVMGQDLVDHDLEEERRYEREDLQEKRGDQHLAQQAAVLDHRLKKPGDVEPSRQLGEASAPGKDDEVAVPRCFKLAAPHDYGLAVDWILHKHAAVGDLGQYEEPPVAAAGNRRQRRLG